jgi:predicted SAM-dependent methyltransferase
MLYRGRKVSTYQLISSLTNPKTVPIIAWNLSQPRLYDILNPNCLRMKQKLEPYFKDKKGICIGGALRWKFQNYLETASETINVNVVTQGNQTDYVADASNLYFADSNDYDFVCSSHVLEHVTNPIKAITEWKRVIKNSGIIYCAVPDKRFTFDHNRKSTSLMHIKNDFYTNVTPWDQSHIHEALFEIDRKMAGMTKKQQEKWINEYFEASKENGALIYQPHIHVYAKEDIIGLFKMCKLDILFSTLRGDTVHILAKK